jgi:hypothetical protein
MTTAGRNLVLHLTQAFQASDTQSNISTGKLRARGIDNPLKLTEQSLVLA